MLMTQGNNALRAVGYARFSSDNQRQESIDAQLRAIREYCSRKNYILTNTYEDAALSGTNDKREAFLKMIADSHQGAFDIVVVHKLDRFSRDRYDSAYYKRELRKNKVHLNSVLENLDDSPESVIMEAVLEGMAEYYSKNLAREVRKGMNENALKCMSTGGAPPFGYSLTNEKKFEINEMEADGVRLIFRRILEGKGFDTIIHELNHLGYKTRNGNQFAKNSISSIIRNEKYKDVYVFNKSSAKDYEGKRNSHLYKSDEDIIRIEGGIPAIVSETDFDAIQAIIKGRQRKTASASAKEVYLLSGRIFCGECGKSYIGNRKFAGRGKTKHCTYRCNTRERKTSDACTNKEIRREYVERFVLERLSDVIFDEKRIPTLIKKYSEYVTKTDKDAQSKLMVLQKQKTDIDRKLNNLVSLIADTANPSLMAGLEKLEKEKRDIETLISKTEYSAGVILLPEAKLKEAFENARWLFLQGTLPQIRQLIALYVQKVIIHKEQVEVIINLLNLYGENDKSHNSLSNECGFGGGGEGSRTPVRNHIL